MHLGHPGLAAPDGPGLGWVVPALTSLLARTSPLGAARLNLAALPAAALLLAALSLAMPMDTYQRPAWADRALQHLTNQAVRLGDGLLEGSGPFGIGSGGGRLADADGSVSLSDAGPLRFSGRTVLEVETDLTGRIYLRGLSDAVYDGESWQPLDEAAYNWQARLAASHMERPSRWTWTLASLGLSPCSPSSSP